jgi:hypothetical protein
MELLQTGLLKSGYSGGDSHDRRRVEANHSELFLNYRFPAIPIRGADENLQPSGPEQGERKSLSGKLVRIGDTPMLQCAILQ